MSAVAAGSRLDLSTAEIQNEAIALYRSAGYRLVRKELAQYASNKTVGSGLRRLYFEKACSEARLDSPIGYLRRATLA